MTLRRLTLFASAIALVAATSISIDATAEIVYRATNHLHVPTQTPTPVETALAITASGSTQYAYAAPWSLHFTADGGTAPYTFTTENFPAGVAFTDDGKVLTVAGVAAKGTYDDLRVLVRDAAGTLVTHSFSASVSDPVNALSIAGLGAPAPAT